MAKGFFLHIEENECSVWTPGMHLIQVQVPNMYQLLLCAAGEDMGMCCMDHRRQPFMGLCPLILKSLGNHLNENTNYFKTP